MSRAVRNTVVWIALAAGVSLICAAVELPEIGIVSREMSLGLVGLGLVGLQVALGVSAGVYVRSWAPWWMSFLRNAAALALLVAGMLCFGLVGADEGAPMSERRLFSIGFAASGCTCLVGSFALSLLPLFLKRG